MNHDRTARDAEVIPLDHASLHAWPLPALHEECDKESRGHVLVVGGSEETPGAVILAAEAALRAGAGKLVIGAPHAIAAAVAIAVPESRVIPLREASLAHAEADAASYIASSCKGIDAMLIGPGMRDEGATIELTRKLMRALPGVPAVLDAYAMGAVLDADPSTSRAIAITPHAGEMAHLTGRAKDSIVRDALSEALSAAAAWGSTVVLKGASTFIAAPGQRVHRHDGGHNGLATSGSGDVLAGLIAGFAARGAPIVQACAYGVVLHARAADRLAERVGAIGFLAREISPEVPALLHQMERLKALDGERVTTVP